ncbi:MAG: hypothetical protein II345_05425 [Alistipes sp.]|jgi:hypothetical protein|nr:hypothetical protein [Alistipes sp.]MBQ5619830.1 hypothetical protein [Alistipes sp.]
MAIRKAIIALDFDGTVVTHAYPEVGEDIGAVAVLKELVAQEDKLILWTMRSGTLLEDAVAWFKKHDIPLWGINENPSQKEWTESPKLHADLLIDDSALGCPTCFLDGERRPAADWRRIREMLVRMGYLD